MTAYYFVFGVLALLSVANYVRGFRQFRLPFFLISVILLVLFAGLRGPLVGVDYNSYVLAFQTVPDISYWLTGEYSYSLTQLWMEPAYIFFSALVKTFTEDYRWMFLGVAFLSVGIAAYNYYKLSSYVFLTLLLFFIHTYLIRDMGQIRSAIAAAIGLFLIPQLSMQYRIKPIVTIAVAGLFHLGSLSFLLAYFASFLKVSRRLIVLGLGISFLFPIFGVSKALLGIGVGNVKDKIEGYLASEYANELGMFDIVNIKNLAIMCLILIFWDRLSKKIAFFETLVLFMFLATAWRIGFHDSGIFAGRIATFFGIVEVILVPSFIMIFKNKLIISLFVIAYAFFTFYLNVISKSIINPYDLAF